MAYVLMNIAAIKLYHCQIIRDVLVNARKGTSQVRKFRITMLFIEYMTFKMKDNESLQEIITRLTIW